MRTLKNREAIVEELAEMLKKFDMQLNEYQTDVYLYYDEEEQTAELDTFTNVGGNSWLNDDHYTIYSDKEHFESYFDIFEETSDFASAVGIPEKELIAKAAKYFEADTDEIGRYELEKYIESDESLMKHLIESYEDALDERNNDYLDRAEYFISEWETADERADF